MKLPKHKCGLYLEHNANRDYYDSVEQYLEVNTHYQFKDDASRQACIDSNELWTLQWYPDTPVGFIAVAAPSLDELLELANSGES
jgi:hypothetical protein